MGSLQQLFSADFMPHGVCNLWEPRILWLHGISNGLIALSYFCIPLILIYFIRKNRHLPSVLRIVHKHGGRAWAEAGHRQERDILFHPRDGPNNEFINQRSYGWRPIMKLTELCEVDILLVEDNQDDADIALHTLKREKLANKIYVAQDGEEALDFLFCRGAFTERSLDVPPKLVLLDLKLPKVGGMEVLKEIKSDPRTKNIPVVIMTSSKDERDPVASYNLSANSYVQKPVDFDQFRETVKTVGLNWLVVNQPPVAESSTMPGATDGSH